MITKPALRSGVVRALACAALLSAAFGSHAQSTVVDYAPGRLVVEARAGLPDRALQNILDEHGGGKARRIGRTNMHVITLPASGGEEALVERLSRHPHLKFAALDRRFKPELTTVNDPYIGSEWHIDKIGASTAWDSAKGVGVTIAICDTGVDGTHPDLAPNMVAGWNFYDNNSDTSDVYGHGTRVAGTAAAALNNGVGVAGVAGGARIMPLRISAPDGWAYASTIAQGISWAADHGARVANASYDVSSDPSVQSAGNYMKSKGGLVTIAAGNAGTVMSYARTTAVIPVSATDSSDTVTSWSNTGDYIALAAPGYAIYTTAPGSAYANTVGTSFAAPIVAGVAALVMSANPSLSASQVESLLFKTALDLGVAGRDAQYGFGRVNAAGAVQAALTTTSVVTTDTQAPQVAITSPGASATASGVVSVSVSASDNVGVTKVELRVNGTLIGTDTGSPYSFAWDSTTLANGSATLVATAYDAAGNSAASAPVTVTASNVADTVPPTVAIMNPKDGSKLSGNAMIISSSASDNGGTANLRQNLLIDGAIVASGTGGSLSYRWNLNKVKSGGHTVTVTATDAAGNVARQSVSVTK